MQQYSLPSGLGVTLDIDPDDAHFTSSFTLENEIPWTSMERYLLRHVFRCLRIEEKAWVGLEVMSVSQDAKHHIGSVIFSPFKICFDLCMPSSQMKTTYYWTSKKSEIGMGMRLRVLPVSM
jgi:hypothetical protein